MYSEILNKLIKLPTPLVDLGVFNGVKMLVKRDDLTHEEISGNKWRKLKRNIEYYFQNDYKGIISFGGAFSNHVFSLSALCYYLDIPLIVLIRGEDANVSNSTLSVLIKRGQSVVKVSREAYKKKELDTGIKTIIQNFPDYYVIPEGGSNQLALEGMKELVEEIDLQNDKYHYLACSAGTFGTATGIYKSLSNEKKLVVYPALKGNWVHQEVNKWLTTSVNLPNLFIRDFYHFGGYGKGISEMKGIIDHFKSNYNLPLDPVYTAKALSGIMNDIILGFYEEGTTVVFYHSGGLQGVNVEL